MNILICGSSNSGCERILRLIIHIFKNKNMPLHVIQNYQKDSSVKELSKNESSTVCLCTHFWDVYTDIKQFDHVILCIRDCRTICKSISEMIKYCEQVQCWNIFSHVTLKYELYGPSQIKEITNRLNLPFTHGDIISLVDKVRIIGIKDNDIDWKEKEIQSTFFVHKYLEDFNYYIPIQQDPKANDLHHSVSWTSSLKVT